MRYRERRALRACTDTRHARRARSLAVAALVLLVARPLAAQTLRAFTPDDALQVRSVRIADVTDDGRRVAATVQRRIDRLNVDHRRFGDPTYVAPSLVQVLVIDTRTGDVRSLYDDPVQARGFRWDPAGERLAFFMLRRSAYGLYVHDARAGTTREVVLGTGKQIASNSSLVWSPDGARILLSLRPDGWAEEARRAFLDLTEGPIVVQDSRNDFLAWDRVRNLGLRAVPALVDAGSGEVTEILPEQPIRSPHFAKDGSFLTYVKATPKKTAYKRGQGTEYEVFRLDLAGGAPVSVMGPRERRIAPRWSHAGDAFAYAEKGNVFVRRLDADSAVNLTADDRKPLSEDDSTKLSFTLDRWRADDGSLLVRSQQGYYLLDPDDGALRQVYTFAADEEARPRLSVEGWSDDGRYLFLATSAADRWERGLLRYDLRQGAGRDLVRDAGLYRDWHVSKDGRTFVYRRSDGDRPDEVYVAHGDFSDARKLTDLNPQLADVALTHSELVSYLDVDGRKLYGILYYPRGYEAGKRYPLVAEVYETFFDNGYNENMNLITARGWFGFRPSVNLRIGYPGEAWVKGVTTGINTLIERGLVDRDRLGVHGTSYGGYATNLLITQTDRFAAAVNISGKVDIISFLGDSPKITTRNYRAAEEGQDRIGATLWEQPLKYVAHSAVMFADRITTPLLMLTGEGDWNVPATNEREMYYALRRLGKEVVWVNYMRAGHGAGRAGTPEDYRDHWQRMFDWYRTHFEKAKEKAERKRGKPAG